MHHLSIAKRLWLNLSFAIVVALAIATGGINGLWKAQNSSESLILLESEEVNPVEDFYDAFNRSIDQMMKALLVRSEQDLQAFMDTVSQQRDDLKNLMAQKNIALELDSSGFYRPVDKTTDDAEESAEQAAENSQEKVSEKAGSEGMNENPAIEKELLESLSLEDYLRIDPILVNMEKSVQSYLFLRKDIENTYEFGIETSVANMQKSLTELMASETAQESTPLQAMLNEWQQRLDQSKKLAVMLMASQDFVYVEQFHQDGLGDQADPLVEQLGEALSGAFLLQESLDSLVNSRDSLYESIADIRDALQTVRENNQTMSELVSNGQDYFETLLSAYQEKRLGSLEEVQQVSGERSQWMLWIAIAGLIAMVLVNLLFIRSINRPLSNMKQQVNQVQKTMVFDQWKTSKGSNELVAMEHSIEQMLKTFSEAMQEVMQSSQAMAEGDLSRTISDHYQGDLQVMANHFNSSLQGMQHILNEIENISVALAQGDLNYQIVPADYPGQYQLVMQRLQQAIQEQKHAIDEVKGISLAMEKGNFTQRIEHEMPGDLSQLKAHLNDALNNLESAIMHKVSALEAYSSGDFSYEMQGDYQGHLLELKEHMQSMAKKISRMLKDVQDSTHKAENGVLEISQGNQELNHRVQKQSTFIQKTSQQMGAMVSFLEGSFQQSNEMAQASVAVKQESNSGRDTIEEMVQSMQEIQQASQQIAAMTDSIDSIAFQTNLLALNASVEAARAGESGRGFAVVAQEVRSLAQGAAELSKQIRGVSEMTLEKVDKGMKLSEATQNIFEKNAQSIDKISRQALKMQGSIETQNASIVEVNSALHEIENVTQATAELVEQVTATSAQIIEEMTGLQEKMATFALHQSEILTIDNLAASEPLTLPRPLH